ncbi:hypothetical protein [Bacillus canaveralius]|uniref:hypothetical protein n=1 Tax=Bacillus canaveralius TaxID=1403243 RepID=UPI0015E0F019|nr:hypothetical protein [Bacillus canaveralius]
MTEEKGQNKGKKKDKNVKNGSLLPKRISEKNTDPFLIEGKGDPNLSPDAGRPLI